LHPSIFLPLIFGIDDADGREQLGAALARYTAAMSRHHCQDELIPVGQDSRPAQVANA